MTHFTHRYQPDLVTCTMDMGFTCMESDCTLQVDIDMDIDFEGVYVPVIYFQSR